MTQKEANENTSIGLHWRR